MVMGAPMSAAMAEGIFLQLGAEARASAERDVERAAQPPRGENDEGVVVITIIAAAKREIVDIHDHEDAFHIHRLLDDLASVASPKSLVALEVIWSPAGEKDRMSKAELESRHPRLKKIDERSMWTVGLPKFEQTEKGAALKATYDESRA
jgi:hypothetical protein